MSRRGGWSARVVAPSARRSVAPLRRTPGSKSSLCAYPHVLPHLQRITAPEFHNPLASVGGQPAYRCGNRCKRRPNCTSNYCSLSDHVVHASNTSCTQATCHAHEPRVMYMSNALCTRAMRRTCGRCVVHASHASCMWAMHRACGRCVMHTVDACPASAHAGGAVISRK